MWRASAGPTTGRHLYQYVSNLCHSSDATVTWSASAHVEVVCSTPVVHSHHADCLPWPVQVHRRRLRSSTGSAPRTALSVAVEGAARVVARLGLVPPSWGASMCQARPVCPPRPARPPMRPPQSARLICHPRPAQLPVCPRPARLMCHPRPAPPTYHPRQARLPLRPPRPPRSACRRGAFKT